MKKTKITLWTSLLFFGLFFVFTSKVSAEVIRDFSSTINVMPDSSIILEEKISYDFEDVLRRGIIRTIPLFNSKNEPIKIEVISVTLDGSNFDKFTTDITDNKLTIKIIDSSRFISGIKEYTIMYRVWGSISYFNNFDEIYWDATDSSWQVPILKSETSVILPNNVFPTQRSCYYGKLESKIPCNVSDSNIYSSEKIFNAKEGITIAIGFQKGIVSPYYTEIKIEKYKVLKTFWPVLIPIIVFIFMYISWYKKGRNQKGTGIVVPQYDVFENLTPLEVGGIINGKVMDQDISAEIIYLATKGYIKIKQIDETCDNFLCLISKKDYQFTLLKHIGLLSNPFDKIIMKAIFEEGGEVGGVSKLSDLNNHFYKSIKYVTNSVADSLLNKEYYTNFSKNKNKNIFVLGLLLLGISILANNFLDIKKLIIFISSLVLSIIIYYIFDGMMTAKSHKGARAREYFLGLKEYLQIAEKDRLNFHNDPGKNPETFEILLPYAMIFSVEELWAKEFKGVYINQPKWYDNKSSNFDVVSFGHEMAVFSSLSTISLTSKSSSNGNK